MIEKGKRKSIKIRSDDNDLYFSIDKQTIVFINRMLSKNPLKRPDAIQVKNKFKGMHLIDREKQFLMRILSEIFAKLLADSYTKSSLSQPNDHPHRIAKQNNICDENIPLQKM